jgi:hypothetical protein
MKTVRDIIKCDTGDCNFYEYVDPSVNGRTQIADRKKRGWTRDVKEKKDYCPLCSHGNA